MRALDAVLSRRSLLLAAGATLALAACAPGADRRLRMACGEPGGTYVQFGQLLADAIVAKGAATSMEVLTTDGSIENMTMLRDGDVDLAIALADSAASVPAGLVAIGRVYQNYLQCVVLVDGPVREAADLAGRRVSIGAPGSGTAYTATRVLDALGLTGDGGAMLEELNLADAVTALGDGEIAALFWSGGIPVPELDRLQDVAEVTLVEVAQALPTLAVEDVYQSTIVPAGVYGLAEPMPTIGVSNLLLARADLAGDLAAGIVDVLVDDAPELVPEPSAGVQYLTPSNLIDTAPIPLHAAAADRYLERYG